MKLSLTYPEAALLEYVIDLCYEKYAKPPFEDVEDRFSIVMDPTQDIIAAAERLDKRDEARKKNDLLDELGYNDDPNSPGFIAQFKKAEFYATRSMIRRWFNGLQFSIYSRARFSANQEETLNDYWARHDHPRVLILFDSLEEDAGRTLYLEPDALDDLRSIVHFICDFVQRVTPQFIRERERVRLAKLAGTEEKVNEDQLNEYWKKSESIHNMFQGALRPLVENLLSTYRQSKFAKVM